MQHLCPPSRSSTNSAEFIDHYHYCIRLAEYYRWSAQHSPFGNDPITGYPLQSRAADLNAPLDMHREANAMSRKAMSAYWLQQARKCRISGKGHRRYAHRSYHCIG
jgi:hypothetical protein